MKAKEELNKEELAQVTGGVGPGCGSGGGIYTSGPSGPDAPSNPSTPKESYTIPVKGEDTEHVDIG